MRNPLALLEVCNQPGAEIQGWLTVQTEKAARGIRARRILFVRPPTDTERSSVECCLLPGGKVATLDDLLSPPLV